MSDAGGERGVFSGADGFNGFEGRVKAGSLAIQKSLYVHQC